MGGDANMGLSRKGVGSQEKEFRRGLEGGTLLAARPRRQSLVFSDTTVLVHP